MGQAGLTQKLGRAVIGLAAAGLLFAGEATVSPSLARGAPDSFADLAEKLTPAVVNISSAQSVDGGRASG